MWGGGQRGNGRGKGWKCNRILIKEVDDCAAVPAVLTMGDTYGKVRGNIGKRQVRYTMETGQSGEGDKEDGDDLFTQPPSSTSPSSLSLSLDDWLLIIFLPPLTYVSPSPSPRCLT